MDYRIVGNDRRSAMVAMIHHGDCLDVMRTMPDASVDAIVTDPPYGLEFMGKAWDAPWRKGAGIGEHNAGFAAMDGAPDKREGNEGGTWFGSRASTAPNYTGSTNPTCRNCGGTQNGRDRKSRRRCKCDAPNFPNTTRPRQLAFQEWNYAWGVEALRVAKPGAYLLAFGGTRTFHRLAVALEDAGWIIRDTLVWAYASGFPKGRANLKPAWEPIVMARKPGPLRHLNIDECRIPGKWSTWRRSDGSINPDQGFRDEYVGGESKGQFSSDEHPAGRWPANVILTDPIFDGGVEGVVGGGQTESGKMMPTEVRNKRTVFGQDAGDGYTTIETYGDSGTYSRFFLIPKADRSDREPVLRGTLPEGKVAGRNRADGRQWDIPGSTVANGKRDRENVHPTVKPTELMRHLVRLVTPPGGVVLDPFLGSGTTAIAAEQEGFEWIGIEKEAEYVAIAEARLNGVQRGLGLDVPAPTRKPPKTHPDLSKHQPKVQHGDSSMFKWRGFDKTEPEEAA